MLVASMLSPGALMAMPREQIKGLVLQSGAIHAHVAILAKAMKIPTLMGCNMDLSQMKDGQKAIVDLSEAKLILQPDEKRYLKVLRKGNEQSTKSPGIAEERFLQSGMKICANLTTLEELTEEVDGTLLQKALDIIQAIAPAKEPVPVTPHTKDDLSLNSHGDVEIPQEQIIGLDAKLFGDKIIRTAMVKVAN